MKRTSAKSAQTNDPMPRDVRPMLAKLTAQPFDRKNWFFEIKWDGYRAIAELAQGRVELYSRKGNSFTRTYTPVVKALKKIRHNCVLDGEIVALKNGKPDFHTLQQFQEKPVPLLYVLFDILYLDGEDLQQKPLHERKKILKKIIPKKSDVLLFSEHVETQGRDYFKTVVEQGIEGMVAKDADAPYRQGARSDEWLKIKNIQEQEAVIAGFTAPRGSRKYLGALVLGAYENGKFVYVGHSGGGFTEKELRELTTHLKKNKTSKSPFATKVPVNAPVTWVEPKYVANIKFTEWTPEGHMRHPIYAGLREDKKPREVTKEMPESPPAQEPAPAKTSFTHTDKIFWPEEGYTKGDVITYYERMASTLLPYLKDRPENLFRTPNGIAAKGFFQKNITEALPPFAQTSTIWSESNDANLRYMLCQNKETLLYMANLGCIEINPWNSRTQSLDNPDYMIIDLDPGENTFEEVIIVAQEVRRVLSLACEEHFVKTSGKTGLHILVPLGAQYSYDEIVPFAKVLMQLVHERLPDLTSLERSPRKRTDKIYLDYLQNRRGQTIAAPYSLRPVPGATVSTPLEWREVRKGLDPKKFTIKTIFKRLEQKGDLLRPLLTKRIDLKESVRCLQEYLDIRLEPPARKRVR